MIENCVKEEASMLALEAGFMLDSSYGQAADKMMPVTDIDTARMLIDLARRDLKAKLAEAEAQVKMRETHLTDVVAACAIEDEDCSNRILPAGDYIENASERVA